MCKSKMLRALVSDLLTAAAEEICELFERTRAEYEEELCRCKKKNQQLQNTRALLHRKEALAQTSSSCPPEFSLNQELTKSKSESPIKEGPDEPIVKQEDSVVSVKSEDESSMLDQRQNELREGICSEPHFHSEIEKDRSSKMDNENDCVPEFSCSAEQMKTEADGDPIRDGSNTPQSTQNKSASERSVVHNGGMSGTNEGAGKNQCSVCQDIFTCELGLQRHLSVHTGGVLYSCPICMKAYTRKFRLEGHMRTHNNEKPFSCSLCKKTFSRNDCLRNHMRTHTGEKPFQCPTCNKAFSDKSNLTEHRRIHTGERPYSCTHCDKSYGRKGCLKSHMRTHTGEKNHSCPLCGKKFGRKGEVNVHMRSHTGEKPYVCSVCSKAFSVRSNLTAHMKIHEEK